MLKIIQPTCRSLVMEPQVFGGVLGPDDPMRGGVLLLGNFDGFHRGHRELVARAQVLSLGRPIGLMSCEPHPRAFFDVEPEPFRLVTPDSKILRLTGTGVDYLYQPHFDAAFAGQAPEEFADNILVKGLGVSHVVTGPDFRFGRKRSGDVATLRELGRVHGFGVSTTAKLTCNGSNVSSSRIRELIRAGKMRAARELLSGDWVMETIRDADGSLYMHESLCRPMPGRYRARTSLNPGATMIDVEIDILRDGQVLPHSPLPTARRNFFHLVNEID